MAYASQQDLIDAFGRDELTQLTDLSSPPLGDIDPAVLTRAQGRADAEIDAALGGRYSLPLAQVPAILLGLASDLTRYFLYRDAVPEVVAKRADNARKILDRIATGQLTLGLPTANATAPVVGGVSYASQTGTFTGTGLDDF